MQWSAALHDMRASEATAVGDVIQTDDAFDACL
jgi:hypothetical protein